MTAKSNCYTVFSKVKNNINISKLHLFWNNKHFLKHQLLWNGESSIYINLEVSFLCVTLTLTLTIVDYTNTFNELKILHLKQYYLFFYLISFLKLSKKHIHII